MRRRAPSCARRMVRDGDSRRTRRNGTMSAASTANDLEAAVLGPDDQRITVFDPPSRWEACFTIALYEDRLEVRIPIYVEFDVDAAVIERWQNGIDTKWNEQFDLVADYGPNAEAA